VSKRYRAVIFDLGGVVTGSPLHAIAAYERELGFARDAINRVVAGSGHGGAWGRLERGEIEMEDFFAAFEADCAAAGLTIDARLLMQRIAAIAQPRPAMLRAIGRLRDGGLPVAALTNNWKSGAGDAAHALRDVFDVVIESAIVGLRKPDPRIYQLACTELRVAPSEAIFLDDIGSNLKTARELGMATIKVVEPDEALAELERLTGHSLRD
jgi:putative hydrolase of the HAD superfamily